jgi:DNA-nicking Smr family endonuclease
MHIFTYIYRVAKTLSAEGQRLNVLMKECHTKAAQDLFSHRNTQQSILSMGRLDLHGLHVNEAILCLTDMIPSLRLVGMTNIVIVTGNS